MDKVSWSISSSSPSTELENPYFLITKNAYVKVNVDEFNIIFSNNAQRKIDDKLWK
jgi:hypothetical protein